MGPASAEIKDTTDALMCPPNGQHLIRLHIYTYSYIYIIYMYIFIFVMLLSGYTTYLTYCCIHAWDKWLHLFNIYQLSKLTGLLAHALHALIVYLLSRSCRFVIAICICSKDGMIRIWSQRYVCVFWVRGISLRLWLDDLTVFCNRFCLFSFLK